MLGQARLGTMAATRLLQSTFWLSFPCILGFHPACTCEIVADDGEFVLDDLVVIGGAGRKRVKSHKDQLSTSFDDNHSHRLLRSEVGDSDGASDVLDFILSKPPAGNAERKPGI